MKKLLKKSQQSKLYYFVDGNLVDGIPLYLRGDATYLSGDATGLSGDVTDLRGNVTYLSGDVDDCDISANDRKNGIKISTLIGD